MYEQDDTDLLVYLGLEHAIASLGKIRNQTNFAIDCLLFDTLHI